ncbi:MAG: hypothetical protein C0405_02775, partial [Desulfovibrio sp.]|nr:hypothetical protein [Desulfovibrio sp.]
MSAPDQQHPVAEGQDLSRRDFLRRVAGASVLALTAGGLGAALLDRAGPKAEGGGRIQSGLGDFSIPEFSGAKAR